MELKCSIRQIGVLKAPAIRPSLHHSIHKEITLARSEVLESIWKRKYDRVTVDVSLVGDAFEIDEPQVRQLYLGIREMSNEISFWITPKQEGSQNLTILFYYKVNLLLVVSVPLHVTTEPAAKNWGRICLLFYKLQFD